MLTRHPAPPVPAPPQALHLGPLSLCAALVCAADRAQGQVSLLGALAGRVWAHLFQVELALAAQTQALSLEPCLQLKKV